MINEKEMTEYLLAELTEQRCRYLCGEDNHYTYLWMILNDIGIETPEIIQIRQENMRRRTNKDESKSH